MKCCACNNQVAESAESAESFFIHSHKNALSTSHICISHAIPRPAMVSGAASIQRLLACMLSQVSQQSHFYTDVGKMSVMTNYIETLGTDSADSSDSANVCDAASKRYWVALIPCG